MIYKQTKLQHNPQDHPLSALNYIMEPVTIAAITGGLIAHIGFPAKDNVVENLWARPIAMNKHNTSDNVAI